MWEGFWHIFPGSLNVSLCEAEEQLLGEFLDTILTIYTSPLDFTKIVQDTRFYVQFLDRDVELPAGWLVKVGILVAGKCTRNFVLMKKRCILSYN